MLFANKVHENDSFLAYVAVLCSSLVNQHEHKETIGIAFICNFAKVFFLLRCDLLQVSFSRPENKCAAGMHI